MKHAIVSIIAIVVLVLALLIPAGLATQPESAHAGNGCIIDISGIIGVVVCDGEVVDQLPLPTVKITVPPVTIRPPQVTETVRVPGPTINVPGPTETITVSGPTETVTVPGERTKTVTVRPSTSPPTETVTVSPSGQPTPTGGTVVPDASPSEHVVANGGGSPITKYIDSPAEIIGVSTLTLLLLVGLILLGLWFGYVLGYKDADRENANFLRALSDQLLVRGKHR